MTELQELTKIMEEHPLLHDGGYGCARGTCDDLNSPSPRSRQALLDSVEEFAAAKLWCVANLRPSKTLNRNHTSYGMKHIAEEEIGYITNGVFIAAMLAAGFRMESQPGYNVRFYVTAGSVNRAWERSDILRRQRLSDRCVTSV